MLLKTQTNFCVLKIGKRRAPNAGKRHNSNRGLLTFPFTVLINYEIFSCIGAAVSLPTQVVVHKLLLFAV